MADKRAFAKFDVGYLDNPKMIDVLDASCSAIIMHFASVLYCSQHLTDGVVASKAMQRKSGGTSDDTKLLIDAGLWHAENHDCDSCPQPPAGKVYVHDFLEHNRDAGAAKRVSSKRSAAANVRWEREKAAMQNALQKDDVCNAERERKRENTSSSKPDGFDGAETRSDVQEVIDCMSEVLASNDIKFKIAKTWSTEARRLIDIDGYTAEQICWVIRWAGNDPFWKANILSIPTLRKKFEQLKAKALAEKDKQKPETTSQVAPQYGWAN